MSVSSTPLLARLQAALLGTALTLTLLITAFWITWHGLAQIQFTYSLGYDLLAIDQHIDHYGPSNRYRDDFESTSRAQHEQLFSEIVDAIQNGGKGLAHIQYSTARTQTTLLREPEVVHLQDVANLITLFNRVAVVSLAGLLGLVALYRWRQYSAPRPKHIALGTLGLLLLVGVVLAIMGPKATFYWLHTLVFPDDHQWFFYYQESLMTTLMKAPDLFGYIAAVWAVLALGLFGLAQWALQRWLAPRQPLASPSPTPR